MLGLEHDADAARRELVRSQSAIWTVSRSWICRTRANSSTTRPSLLKPTIRWAGR